ncbi:MAG: hypothetical protein K8R48_01010 [Alphaproteobacteria bacterium]|nr:hypothetical protein [Alphaproteobacteria bacterium]
MSLSGLKKAFNRRAVRLSLGLTLLFSGIAANIDGYNGTSENSTIELVAGGILAIAGAAVCGGIELKEKNPKV